MFLSQPPQNAISDSLPKKAQGTWDTTCPLVDRFCVGVGGCDECPHPACEGDLMKRVLFGTGGQRINRQDYWLRGMLPILACAVVAGLLAGVVEGLSGGAGIGFVIYFIAALVLFVLTIRVAIKRLHDIGKSGAWALFLMIPLVAWLAVVVFGVVKGTVGPNMYGPAPSSAIAEALEETT